MSKHIINLDEINTLDELMQKAKWLEGKALSEIDEEIKHSDRASRVQTKGSVGYVIEEGFFGIKRNSNAACDIEKFGVEIKTCPLKFTSGGKKLTVKEPLSLNIINYCEEYKHSRVEDSSFYKKNKKILFVFYIHAAGADRSAYIIKYVFLWEMDKEVVQDLDADYQKIIKYIRDGEAHEIHQWQHKWLTICPKHGGTFKDPSCNKSKVRQPFSDKAAEIRAFRLKNSYVVRIIEKHLGLPLDSKGWPAN